MESASSNSGHIECDGDRNVSASPVLTTTATTISTIVLQTHPLQVVVGVLQVRN